MDDTMPWKAQRVRFYIDQAAKWQHRNLAIVLLETLCREGCAGTTVFNGVMGFGPRGRIRSSMAIDVAMPLPQVVEWVDTPERIRRLLPILRTMASGALITVEEVWMVQRAQRVLRNISPGLRVRDVMPHPDRVVAATDDASLEEVVVLLLCHARRAVPVVDRAQRVVGIITVGDLVERAGLPFRLEPPLPLGASEDHTAAQPPASFRSVDRTAAVVMTRDVVTTSPDAPVVAAATAMLQQHLRQLPVVDSDGLLVGIVSRIDVLRAAATSGSSADEIERRMVGCNSDRVPYRVDEVVNVHVPTVQRDASLVEVLDAVVSTRLHCAVVVDDEGKPVGIVVETDLLRRIIPYAHPRLLQRLMRWGWPGTPESREEWQRLTGEHAADVMWPLGEMLVVPPDMPIAAASERSLTRQTNLIAVVDERGNVTGMADRADLLAALATHIVAV